MSLGVLDYVCLGVMLLAVVRGIARGFIAEFFSVGAVVAGIAAAVLFSGSLAEPVGRAVGLPGWGQPIAFLAVFLVVYILSKILERGLHELVERIHLENLDRALGFFLGIVEGVVVVSLILLILSLQPFVDVDRLLEASLIARVILPLILTAAQTVQPGLLPPAGA